MAGSTSISLPNVGRPPSLPGVNNQKSTKSLAQRHIAKLREESLELRAQSDTFTAEVAALEELVQRSEEGTVADEESEKKIWENLQKLLHKRYLAEMNSLRTAAALTGRQLPMKAPSTSSEEDSSYASSPASHELATDKLDDVGSRLTASGDSSSDHGKSANDSTDTPQSTTRCTIHSNEVSNDEGSEKSDERDEPQMSDEPDEVGSVFSFSGIKKKPAEARKAHAPPSEGFVPAPRWISEANKARRPESPSPKPSPFASVLGSAIPELPPDHKFYAATIPTMQGTPAPKTSPAETFAQVSARLKRTPQHAELFTSTACSPRQQTENDSPATAAPQSARGDSSSKAVAAKCAAVMERSAVALTSSRSTRGYTSKMTENDSPGTPTPPVERKSPFTYASHSLESAGKMAAAKKAAAKCVEAMERSAAAQKIPLDVPSSDLQKKQAPLQEPAPAAPKDRSRSEILAMARVARAAAAKKVGAAEEMQVPLSSRLSKKEGESPPFPPHLREMANELKHQINELQSALGASQAKVSAEGEVDAVLLSADGFHRETERAVAKARETMERHPSRESSVLVGPSPRSGIGSTPRMQGNRDRPALGQSAPNLPTYMREPGLPRCSPRSSPRASQFPVGQPQQPQELHSTAPTLTRVAPAQQRRPDASPSSQVFGKSPVVPSRGGRGSPSSSPVQHGRQGQPYSPMPRQGYGQPQVPQGLRPPGSAWYQSPLAGFR